MQKMPMIKMQHPFMTKPLMKQGMEGMYLNIIRPRSDKPTANNIVNGKKTENISSKVRNKTNVCTVSTLIQHCLGIPEIETRSMSVILYKYQPSVD
jgi:hypothetical protein